MKTFAVCEFYKDGSAFPVGLDLTQPKAEQLRAWMRVGVGGNQDWRVVPMTDLVPLLDAGKLRLNCFTAEAQAERVAIIREKGAA